MDHPIALLLYVLSPSASLVTLACRTATCRLHMSGSFQVRLVYKRENEQTGFIYPPY